MKQNLHKVTFVISFIILTTYLPGTIKAQCLCSEGATPDSVVQNLYFDSITAINTSVVFSQFDPTIGTLQCFNLSSTVTTVLTFDLFNKENFMDTYLFESFRRSRFSGPSGFSSSVLSPVKEYGPYDLDPVDPVGTTDEVHVGPDTVFNGQYTSTYYTGSGAYIGTGNVTFDYLNTSTTTLLDGSSNYDLFVRGYTRLNARLVYYWCPTEILASNIKNFTAIKKNNSVQLQWQVENEESTNRYEILASKDGHAFTAIGRTATATPAEGVVAAYDYQYALNQSARGKLFFRIKQTNAAGKVSFSPIRIINMDDQAIGSVGIYPNPVVRNISLQFDRELKGNYKVEIVNKLGQVVFSRFMQLNNQSNIGLQLTNPPANGIYYVRVKSTETNQLFTNKLLVQH